MTNREIVEKIAKEGLVEECIKLVTGGKWRPEYNDLTQDLLLELLEEEKLQGLYERGQLKYFIIRLVRNNIQSKTSRFWTKYRRFSSYSQELQPFHLLQEEDTQGGSIKPDYLHDSEYIYRLKEEYLKLPSVDKIILNLYNRLGSYKALSGVLGISTSSCFWAVRRIREKLKKSLQDIEK